MAANNAQHLTDADIEVKQATARVKRLTKKQAALQAQLNTLNTITAAAIAPLEDDLEAARKRLAAVNEREAAFKAKCAARMAAAASKA